MLALLYAVVAHESPGIVPTVGDLAWIAELGEETAVDTACTEIDRMVRLLLDDDHATVMGRIEDMLSAEERHHNWRIHGEIVRLAAAYDTVIRPYGRMGSEPVRVGLPLDGVRHILDALLVIADDGHAPGTRVRIMPAPYNGWNGTIVGIVWGPTGPPLRYNVHPDAASEPIFVAPRDLVVVSSTEVGLGWPQV
ncbi:hypothetical protein AB0K60_19740 [Thermopolyspora sp. NPDC052614]|uniref:hypothetical protein n=1 Tax=Thermopolyspora sp. NPDC052614 TaxID=3155682 RepID=UPI00341CBABE